MNDQIWDVVIVGGGMAGGLMAAALLDSGLRVQLLDAAPQPQPPTGLIRPRVSALTEASVRMLRRLGVEPLLAADRVLPYQSMQVWDGDGTGQVDFHARDAGAEALGWMVENDAVVAALYQRVAPQLPWRVSTSVVDLQRHALGWQITLADGETLVTRLLVGADGAHSSVRDRLGIAGTPRPSGHWAVVGTIATELPHGACARQRFIDSGPLALLPMGGADAPCSIVWSTSEADAKRLAALPEAAFNQALTLASEGVLGALSIQGPRGCFPIIERHASSYVGRHAALIGDAAHVVHPLAGQGINLGMLDAAVLAEELLRAHARGLPLSSPATLARYERRRRGHNLLMQQSFHGLKWLFEQPALPLRLLRNLGLRGVQQAPPLKQFFVQQALGRRGDLPALARA